MSILCSRGAPPIYHLRDHVLDAPPEPFQNIGRGTARSHLNPGFPSPELLPESTNISRQPDTPPGRYVPFWEGYHESRNAQGTPTQSHISPSILVYKDKTFRIDGRNSTHESDIRRETGLPSPQRGGAVQQHRQTVTPGTNSHDSAILNTQRHISPSILE